MAHFFSSSEGAAESSIIYLILWVPLTVFIISLIPSRDRWQGPTGRGNGSGGIYELTAVVLQLQ